jgi:transcription initiation factor IIE alpha subunit
MGVLGYLGVFMKNILVYLDEEDLIAFKKMKEYESKVTETKLKSDIVNYNKALLAFKKHLLDKYGILRNKQIYIEPQYGYVYDISGRI